ncbi:SGNH/GDSL hydrolase family protein [Neobacillus sp. YIM B06451]|uniref:SGNH/GDSL hydrolase family protein n=1 Tax=Neobacillus sp. YIM B06451 TaxID=3070994 RepID=UPI00292FA612|nr:SGNH/GDSL hydrolase family protein [Neobacillus sp. YIM B06451]
MKKTSIRMLIIPAVLLFIFWGIFNPFTSAKEAPASTVGFYKKIANGSDFSYMIIGDSIGRGSGVSNRDETWFALFEKQIKRDYGSAGVRHSIVQSGATSFEGIIKYEREKPATPVALVFIVFGENDRKYMDALQFSFFYEQLLRKVKTDYPYADIITFTESSLTNDEFAQTISTISAQYGAMNLDMRVPFRKSGLDARKLTRDLVHPNKLGYELYSRELAKSIKTSIKSEKGALPLPAPLHTGLSKNYMNIWEPVKKSGFVKRGSGFISQEKGSLIEFEFSGEMVGYKVERSPHGGEVEVFIDGKSFGTVSTWWPFKRERNIYLAGSLGKGPHQIRFIHTGKISNNGSQTAKPSVHIKAIIAEKDTP